MIDAWLVLDCESAQKRVDIAYINPAYPHGTEL
jgi:hypothetical protein